MSFHLAQVNIALLRAPADDPVNASYMARLDELNALADASPGFVWRYLTDSRDPAQRELEDPLVLFNMSIWDSLAALHAYTYRSAHAEAYAKRRTWFVSSAPRAATGPIPTSRASGRSRRPDGFVEPESHTGLAHLACWWIPVGERPTVDEGRRRLASVREHGPTPYAFTFKTAWGPDGEPLRAPSVR